VPPSMVAQTILLTRRSILQLRRGLLVELSDILLILIAGLVVGIMFRGTKIHDILRAQFMVVLCTAIVGIQQSLRLFGSERIVYWREASNGINKTAYFLAKNFASLFHLIAGPLFFLSIFYGFNGPRIGFIDYYRILILAQFVAQGIGHFISLVLDPNKAQLAGVVAALMLAMVAGANPTIPELENLGLLGRVVSVLAYTRYQLEALFCTETVSISQVFKSLLEQLEDNFGYQCSDGIGGAILALVLMAFINRGFNYAALRLLNRARQL